LEDDFIYNCRKGFENFVMALDSLSSSTYISVKENKQQAQPKSTLAVNKMKLGLTLAV
jgi:hypothetical protein